MLWGTKLSRKLASSIASDDEAEVHICVLSSGSSTCQVCLDSCTHTTYQRQACVAKGLSTQGGHIQPQLWSSLSEPTWAREMRWLWVDTAQSPETLAKDLCAKTCRLVPQAPMTSLANMESIINQHNQGLERSA